MKGILPLAILGIQIAAEPPSLAQQGPDPALQRLNECVATPRAKPSTQEDIFKSFNPAISDPDRVSWCLFLYVNSLSTTAGNNNALFETWASDGETFNPNPQWPTTPAPKVLRPNILLQIREADRAFQLGKQGRAFQPFVLPPPRPLKEGDPPQQDRLRLYRFARSSQDFGSAKGVRDLHAGSQASRLPRRRDRGQGELVSRAGPAGSNQERHSRIYGQSGRRGQVLSCEQRGR